jgi:hypothetical protein
MFLRLFAIETRKTLKHPALWLGLAALLFLLATFMLINHLQIANGFRTASGGLEKDLLDGLAFFNWLGILVYAVIGAMIAAFDYMDRSIHLWLTRGVTRLMLLSARLAAILFFALLIVSFTVIAFLGLGVLSRSLFFHAVETSNLNLSALLPVGLRVFWSSLPYLALSVLLGMFSRSPLFAAGGTIVYASVVERFIPALSERVPWLTRYLPGSLSRVLQSRNIALDLSAKPLPMSATLMPELQVVLLIGCIFLLLSIASLVIFSHQDLGG